jgi:hypothetical protein
MSWRRDNSPQVSKSQYEAEAPNAPHKPSLTARNARKRAVAGDIMWLTAKEKK